MKRYIRASLSPSTPEWLRFALTKDFGETLSKRYNVALDRVKFDNVQPEGKSLAIYNINSGYGYPVVYAPGVNDGKEMEINGRWRNLGSVAKSKLPQMADDIVWIDLDDPNNTYERKSKYQDPRYEYRYSDKGRYAGQYKQRNYVGNGVYEEGDWSEYGRTPTNERMHRDKSGYKIPRPEEMIARFYSKFPDKITDKVDRVYNRMLEVRSKLTSTDFNNVAKEWGDTDIRNAYSRYGDAVSDYKRLLYLVQNQRDELGNLTTRFGYGEGYSEFSNLVKAIMSDLNDVEEFLGESAGR